MKSPLLLLCLLWSLVEVHSQTVPYVTFMGNILPNHAYVNLFLVGNDSSSSVQCHTDLDTCCSHVQDRNDSDHRGNWIPPGNESRLPFRYQASGDIIYEFHQDQRVELHRRNNADKPSGIYRCDIPTNAVHDNNDTTMRESVYVGLYASGGDITISGGMTFAVDSNLNTTIPQFTLTCISTGGPATSVTWTRDTETLTEGTETVLDDRVTAQYTHTLTVTGRLGGLYTCTVANDKPSNDSAQLTVHAPSGAPEMFQAVVKQRQVILSWSPPPVTCNGSIHSYTLSCSPSPSSLPQSFSQSGPQVVPGFSPDTSYSCSVVANNVLGSGPPANTTFTTLRDYSLFQLRLVGLLITCSDLVHTQTDVRLGDITSAVLEQLIRSCAECGITNDIIDKPSFAWYPESPSSVTYRARLEGTSETNSTALISLIEEWVSDGASIIMTGVLMTVDPKCSVTISSLSEEECSSTLTPTTDVGGNVSTPNTLPIVGGVVAVILIITIAVVIIIMTLILKCRCGNVRFNDTNERNVTDLLTRARKCSVEMGVSNPAYEMVKLRGGGGGRGRGEKESHEYDIVGVSLGTNPRTTKCVDDTYAMPSPPSRQLLPRLPLSVAPPTGGGVGVVRKGEEKGVYDSYHP